MLDDEEGTVLVQFTVVVHEVQFSEFLQKETDAGARAADHVTRRVLTDLWNDQLRRCHALLRISRIKFSSMSNCEQTAAWLLGMLSFTPAVCLRPGGDIVTCRVARLSQDLLRIDLAFCSECGSADLEVCYTSKALGPHLCQACAHSMVECGTWKEPQTRSRMREQPVA
jgi:hypothetical protein